MGDLSKKIVLHSISGYLPAHDGLLLRMIHERVHLVCAVGKDCEIWHDVIDEFVVGDGTMEVDFYVDTTFHKDSSLQEVVQFARTFQIEALSEVENKIVQVITV